MRYWQNGANRLTIYCAFVCAMLVALLLVRVAPPSFPRLSSVSPTVNCDRHHDPRPCFDQGELYGLVTIAIFSPEIPVVFSPLMPGAAPVISSYPGGSHYTRPPPLA
jgi:hypothetical protein